MAVVNKLLVLRLQFVLTQNHCRASTSLLDKRSTPLYHKFKKWYATYPTVMTRFRETLSAQTQHRTGRSRRKLTFAASTFRVNNIYKRFPDVLALTDVSLEGKPGEVHAPVGENGASKAYT